MSLVCYPHNIATITWSESLEKLLGGVLSAHIPFVGREPVGG